MVERNESRTLRKHILHAEFSLFVHHLSYKAERAGGRVVVKVDPRNTSKTRAKCGYKKEDLTLSDRVFSCPKCGWTADRDYNASLNILCAGLGLHRGLWTGGLCYTSPFLRVCIVSFLEEAGNPHLEVWVPHPLGRGGSLG